MTHPTKGSALISAVGIVPRYALKPCPAGPLSLSPFNIRRARDFNPATINEWNLIALPQSLGFRIQPTIGCNNQISIDDRSVFERNRSFLDTVVFDFLF